jgi:hypothetical protein
VSEPERVAIVIDQATAEKANVLANEMLRGISNDGVSYESIVVLMAFMMCAAVACKQVGVSKEGSTSIFDSVFERVTEAPTEAH